VEQNAVLYVGRNGNEGTIEDVIQLTVQEGVLFFSDESYFVELRSNLYDGGNCIGCSEKP